MSNKASQPMVIESGDREHFAVRITLTPDPEPGYSGDLSERASWGEFALWANGRNVTANQLWGEHREGFSWYLLPLLEWLTGSWDPLLHEERLPEAFEEVDAAGAAETRPPGLGDADQALAWFTRRQAWLGRHGFTTASVGGRFPNLYMRRWRNMVELSWSDDEPPDRDFAFEDRQGRCLVEPVRLAESLFSVLEQAPHALEARCRETERIGRLQQSVSDLLTPARSVDRAAWLAAAGNNREVVLRRWHELRDAAAEAGRRINADAADAFLAFQGNSLVVTSSPAATLLGSLAPDLQPKDVAEIAQLVANAYDPAAHVKLDDLVELVPVSGEPWRQGYELAEHTHEALGVDTSQPVPAATLIQDLGVLIRDIDICDASARGLAFANADHVPVAAVNIGYTTNPRTEVRRFTLSDSFCHLLFDRDQNRDVALASSRWAPYDVEQRARAFAAMFLMPRPLVQNSIAACPYAIASLGGVRWMAHQMNTSASTTLEHLHNLDAIDYVERDRLREELAFVG